jgi:hypothetical protein
MINHLHPTMLRSTESVPWSGRSHANDHRYAGAGHVQPCPRSTPCGEGQAMCTTNPQPNWPYNPIHQDACPHWWMAQRACYWKMHGTFWIFEYWKFDIVSLRHDRFTNFMSSDGVGRAHHQASGLIRGALPIYAVFGSTTIQQRLSGA